MNFSAANAANIVVLINLGRNQSFSECLILPSAAGIMFLIDFCSKKYAIYFVQYPEPATSWAFPFHGLTQQKQRPKQTDKTKYTYQCATHTRARFFCSYAAYIRDQTSRNCSVKEHSQKYAYEQN